MRETIVITDLTQMPTRDGVCIAGIGQHNKCIRPVLPLDGVRKSHLYIGNKLAITPRAKVRFDLQLVKIDPPHVEDLSFDPKSVVYEGSCSDSEWEKVLKDSSFFQVQSIFGGLLKENRWVEPGANTRSLGTLGQARIDAVDLPVWSGKLRYRLSFRDTTGLFYDHIPISDLVFRELAYSEVRKRGRAPAIVSQQITRIFKGVNRLYLRLGLARPWRNPNTGNVGCWLQVTGIYTFPNYLAGKSFADF